MDKFMLNQPQEQVQSREKEQKPKFGLLIFLLILFSVIGIGFLSYPYAGDLWNRYRNQVLLAGYADQVQRLPEEQYLEMWRKAFIYNQNHHFNTFVDSFDRPDYQPEDPYDSYLNPAGDGIMGSIEIPRIKVRLAIYHGISRDILEHGAGHSEGTSLPIGGRGTHSVISAHRALPQAKLFTDLDQMEIADYFFLRILDKVFVYRINQIKTVLPYQTDDLQIVPDKDYCTLLTCTPYAVNTHRLLVRGERLFKEDLLKISAAELGLSETEYQKILQTANFGYDLDNDLKNAEVALSEQDDANDYFVVQKDVLILHWVIEHWQILSAGMIGFIILLKLRKIICRSKKKRWVI